MKTQCQQKGKDLEEAVRFIEEHTLRASPSASKASLTIESNQVFTVDDIRHEIDIYVKIDHKNSYESVYIFECKNWKTPVGKNEIIVFSEKIKAALAQKGFFVTKKLSKYAKAQALKDKRIEIIYVRDDFKSPLDSMELQAIIQSFSFAGLSVKERDVQPKEKPDILDWKDWKGRKCFYQGSPISFERHFLEMARSAITDDYNRNISKYTLEGSHNGRTCLKIIYDPGELTLGDKDFEWMLMDIQYIITIKKPRIESRFEVAKRGRVFNYEPVVIEELGKAVKITALQLI